jgi:hypothetical protein
VVTGSLNPPGLVVQTWPPAASAADPLPVLSAHLYAGVNGSGDPDYGGFTHGW